MTRHGPGQVDENRLRDLAYGDGATPLTPEERAWCVSEAVWAGEGSLKEAELTPLADKDLAEAVLQAWWDYVRSNCL